MSNTIDKQPKFDTPLGRAIAMHLYAEGFVQRRIANLFDVDFNEVSKLVSGCREDFGMQKKAV